MKLFLSLFLSLVYIFNGNPLPKHMNQNNLNGTWIPVEQEMGGQKLPSSVFADQKLILQDSTYTVSAEHLDKGVVNYHGNQMDIISREGANAGKAFKAIYKIEHGLMTVCYDLSGKDYPQEFSTQGKPLYFMSVFKREQP
jgi:uncharacterized protein (TIGR03067 family)